MKPFSITGVNRYVLVRGSICFLFIFLNVHAEDPMPQDSVQNAHVAYLEEIINELEPDDADQLIDYLESLREVPLDINSAAPSELESLPFLNEREIESIIATRERRGRFYTTRDVYTVPGIDRERIHLLQNFIYVSEEVVIRRYTPSVTLRSHLSSELHERRGYHEGRYLGSPIATYQRVSVGFTPSMYGGMIIAKSAGERSITERSSGYFSIGLMDDRIDITVGDYRVHIGQGLLLWSGFGIAKSGNPARSAVRRSSGVRPAASRSEHYRFRGGTISVRYLNLNAIVFYGNTPRAATVYEDGSVRTLLTYPVYRTDTDREKKNALTERLFGTHIRQSFFRNISVGLTWYSLQYNREFIPDIPSRFSGRKNNHGGIDWSVHYGDIHFFGEAAARLPVKSISVITGFMLPVAQGLDAALVYRSYPSDYTSMYGFPFAERRGVPDDEQGIYLGMRFRPAPRHLIEGYFDVYSFSNNMRSPGLPVNGSDIAGRIEYPVGPASMLDTRVRRRARAFPFVETIGGLDERILIDRYQNNYRVNFITDTSLSLRIRMQYEYVSVSYPSAMKSESGSYVAADIRWNVRSNVLINARYILFGSDSFDSRLYTSEYDMPGRVRTILLNGRGASFSFGVQYTIFNNATISMKYSELFRSDGASIGSGFQEVDGPALGVVMMQIDARW